MQEEELIEIIIDFIIITNIIIIVVVVVAITIVAVQLNGRFYDCFQFGLGKLGLKLWMFGFVEAESFIMGLNITVMIMMIEVWMKKLVHYCGEISEGDEECIQRETSERASGDCSAFPDSDIMSIGEKDGRERFEVLDGMVSVVDANVED
ncbi:MAG: hypothetical protein EZS28_022342 [Streblomastix strix]|uniref:Uncharacterized protein n=1 Tax=Streblomastix strix TaxID=222440 RepID=A0A5J4VHR3_9EUKA|nr:MAG: hypothetical protein EZS28_022342 [Streblomastix strix]